MLHIPGPDLNESPSSILNQVHQALYVHYKNQARFGNSLNGGGSKANAMLLQEFLTAWKTYANGKINTSNIFTNQLLSQLQAQMPASLRQSLFKFNTSGGQKFETELTKFIYGILEGNGSTGMSLQQFLDRANTGQVRTTVEKLDTDVLDGIAYDINQSMAEGVSNELRTTYERAYADLAKLRKSGTLAPIQIKTDISTKEIKVTMTMNNITVDPYMAQIYKLLAKATITAKNYGNDWYTQQLRKMRGMLSDAIHLGDTNTYRAVLSTMRAFGWRDDIINSVYYASYASQDASVFVHFAHMRFIYELTGSGQMINGIISEISDAEYLIWNDPSSATNITVTSTADLIGQLFDEVFETDMSYGVHIRFANLK